MRPFPKNLAALATSKKNMVVKNGFWFQVLQNILFLNTLQGAVAQKAPAKRPDFGKQIKTTKYFHNLPIHVSRTDPVSPGDYGGLK
jgi:hypothetical protein